MNLEELLVQYRRELHQHPELSMQEFATTERLKKWLADHEISIYDLPLATGVIAEIKGALPGPTIALRADIDGLPIAEQTGFDFASVNEGVSHACGHDTHMAMMLGAAILLKKRQQQLRGNVRLLFQPAEEAASGAKWLAQQPGTMDGVEAIFGVHNKPDLPVGSVGVKNGALMASVDRFEIEINGLGGHAGMPERVIDPIVAGSQLVQALQTIVSRRVGSLDNVVVSVTKFQAGNTWNVIPDRALLEGTVRTFQKEARAKIPQLMQNICDGVALASGAEIKFIWHANLSPVVNTPHFAEEAAAVGQRLGLQVIDPTPNLAGEDFAFYLETIPGCFVWVGSGGPYQWHHPSFTIDEACLAVGARYFAALAEDVLSSWNQK